MTPTNEPLAAAVAAVEGALCMPQGMLPSREALVVRIVVDALAAYDAQHAGVAS